MDCGSLQGWIPYVAPKRVIVGEAELDSAVARVKALDCTDARCQNAFSPPRTSGPICTRCLALDALTRISRTEVAT